MVDEAHETAGAFEGHIEDIHRRRLLQPKEPFVGQLAVGERVVESRGRGGVIVDVARAGDPDHLDTSWFRDALGFASAEQVNLMAEPGEGGRDRVSLARDLPGEGRGISWTEESDVHASPEPLPGSSTLALNSSTSRSSAPRTCACLVTARWSS